MEKNKNEMNKKAFLFHVEVLVEGYNQAMAQESLLSLLRTEKVKTIQLQSPTPPVAEHDEEDLQKRKKKETSKSNDAKLTKQQETKQAANTGYQRIINQIEDFKKNNTLIRLSIVKGKGINLSVPCRILNYEDATQNVTIYHVDEKKVYQYSLNEIDDLIVG
jgi:wyosine [tRNA(Phe)-imidazoG37] synthetase (radical SAM superfamily)